MKKFNLLAFLFAILQFSESANAQATDGILWKVSGKGLKKPSYIMGTIHIYNDSSIAKKAIIRSTLKSTDILVTELNLNSFEEMTAMYKAGMDTSAVSMKDRYNKTEYKTIDSVCRVLLGVGLDQLNYKQPNNLMSMMMVSPLMTGVATPIIVDYEITQLANGMAKEVYGLETFAYQDSLLKSIPEATTQRWLYDFCADLGKTKKELSEMMNLYRQQKGKELYHLIMESSPEFKIYQDLLLTNRNLSWADFMNQNMKNISLFMAVGAGHLAGDSGLIQLLRNMGYTLTPVSIK